MDSLLELDKISCSYNGHTVVNDLSLHLTSGMLCSLLGPSGCGKTTVLRAIAGFESLVAGEIRLDGQAISTTRVMLPPEKRRLGMVFQDYALFPHLNLQENIAFGLKNHSSYKQRYESERLLEIVGLAGYGNRYPHELSGGQQQRVALARALAPKPKLLLLDEPFSNLDVDLRERLATDVRGILKDQGAAGIFVTHDQHEAFVMGERVGVMNLGRILQWDTPFNLYHEPAVRFVADFIGQGRFLSGRLMEPDTVETPFGRIVGNRAYGWPRGSRVDILLRPDDVQLEEQSNNTALIVGRAFRGAETLYTIKLPQGGELLSIMPSRYDFAVGQKIGFKFDLDHLVLFQS